jgi:hypothetical protein
VSTADGGTRELCSPGDDGYDKNSMAHFLVMSNELSTPKILVCPSDPSKTAVSDWRYLQPANVSYQVHSGTNVDEAHPNEVLAICPVHGTRLLSDGSVGMPRTRKPR